MSTINPFSKDKLTLTNNADECRIEHQRLESLINSMADGVISTNEKGGIVLYNGAALNILDVNFIKKGSTIESVLNLKNEKHETLDTKSIVLGCKSQTVYRDYKLIYKDKSIASIYLNISPVHLGYGQKGDKGFVIIFRDITHEKSLEEERDEFISVISHELRTPAAITEGSVSNAMYILEKTHDILKVKEALKLAHEQTKYLEEMINDLSTLSRAERGVIHESVEDINAHEFVEKLKDTYINQAEEKGLSLRVDIDPNLTLFRNVRLYITEIMQNFITNAIKYTDEGSVTIHAKQRENGVEFSISDTGIGISKGDQSKVFDKFFRAEDYRTRTQNGTGLGLHVTRKLAQLAKAQISLKSELNEGSEFSVYVPNID